MKKQLKVIPIYKSAQNKNKEFLKRLHKNIMKKKEISKKNHWKIKANLIKLSVKLFIVHLWNDLSIFFSYSQLLIPYYLI